MINYGLDRTGKPIEAEISSLLIVGEPGSGKTVVLAYLVPQFQALGTVLIGDPHGGQRESLLSRLHLKPGAKVAIEDADIRGLIDRSLRELRSRIQGRERTHRPWVLVLDEWVDVLLGPHREEVSDSLQEIVRDGRKFGVFAVLGLQSARARDLPSWVKDAIPAALILRTTTDFSRVLGVPIDFLPQRPSLLKTGQAILRRPGGSLVLVVIPKPVVSAVKSEAKAAVGSGTSLAAESRALGEERDREILETLKDGKAFTVEDLARRTGFHERRIRRGLERLEEQGLVQYKVSDGRRLYHLPVPTAPPERTLSPSLEAELQQLELSIRQRVSAENRRQERMEIARRIKDKGEPIYLFLSSRVQDLTLEARDREEMWVTAGILDRIAAQAARCAEQEGGEEALQELERRLEEELGKPSLQAWVEEAKKAQAEKEEQERQELLDRRRQWAKDSYLPRVGPVLGIYPQRYATAADADWFLLERNHLPGSVPTCRPSVQDTLQAQANGLRDAVCPGCGASWHWTPAGWRPGTSAEPHTLQELQEAIRQAGPDPMLGPHDQSLTGPVRKPRRSGAIQRFADNLVAAMQFPRISALPGGAPQFSVKRIISR